MESSEDEIRELIAKSRAEFRESFNRKQSGLRAQLKARHEDRKESKMFDFNIKKEVRKKSAKSNFYHGLRVKNFLFLKELTWLLKMYNDPVEIEKIQKQQAQLDVQIDVWLTDFENKAAEEEKEFDDKEEAEDNRLTSMSIILIGLTFEC